MKSETAAVEGTFGATWQEQRTIRALTEVMQVVEQAPGLYSVFSGSGNEYTVNVEGRPACDCPDFEKREEVTACKHIRRVYVETGRVAIPAALDRNAMDDLLVRALDAGTARVTGTGRDTGTAAVATDGGRETETEAEEESA